MLLKKSICKIEKLTIKAYLVIIILLEGIWNIWVFTMKMAYIWARKSPEGTKIWQKMNI